MISSAKKLLYGEMKQLRERHEEVSEEVYLKLSDCDEKGQRKELVDKYGYHNNVKFFSDGSIFVDGRKNGGATGWLVPPPATLDKVLPQANKVYGVLEK